jgi:hypothetical protein
MAAITALEAARTRGAAFLVLPGTAYWWLDHYEEFQRYLDRRCHCVWRDAQCVIFDMRGEVAACARNH